jgi:superfamily II DNA or RNA helicase
MRFCHDFLGLFPCYCPEYGSSRDTAQGEKTPILWAQLQFRARGGRTGQHARDAELAGGFFSETCSISRGEKYRVKQFMDAIDQREKTLVFCATQGHALLVRDLVNQMKTSGDPNYCVRVTADDGALGEQWLRTFQDNEKIIPTILTTSQKLSTGVDARNVRNIVLMRPINTMIEFKQIIGRGTRLFEGKDYFTIYDFVRAYEHFNDPEWDGEPPSVLLSQDQRRKMAS